MSRLGCSHSHTRPARTIAVILVLSFLIFLGPLMIENSSRRELSPKSIQHDNATLAATVSAWRDAGGVQPHEPRVGFHAYGGGVRAPGAHHHASDGTPQGRAARHGHPALRHGEGCNLTQLLETFNPDKLPISCQKEYENRVNNGTLEASPKRIQREETNIPVNEKDLVGASYKRIQHDAATLAAIEFARRDDGCDLTHLLETFNPDALPISCKNFHEIKVNDKDILGAGFWRKAVSGSWKGQKVAVKYVVRKDPCSKEKRDGCKMGPNMEAAVHAYLQRTSGSFLPILGKCGSTLVFPKMTPLDPEKDFPLSTRTALRYSLEIAQALAHLHDSPDGPLSYNDLQVDHLLLDGNGKIRLFDFHWLKYNGMPRRRAGGVGDNKRCGHNVTSGLRYLASPEVVAALIPNKVSEAAIREAKQTGGKKGRRKYAELMAAKWTSAGGQQPPARYGSAVHEEADVFFFAHVAWQLLSKTRGEQPPYGRRDYPEIWEGWMKDELRPALSPLARAPREVQAVLHKCWEKSPSKRPRMSAVVGVLKAALDAMPVEEEEVKEEEEEKEVDEEWRKKWKEMKRMMSEGGEEGGNGRKRREDDEEEEEEEEGWLKMWRKMKRMGEEKEDAGDGRKRREEEEEEERLRKGRKKRKRIKRMMEDRRRQRERGRRRTGTIISQRSV